MFASYVTDKTIVREQKLITINTFNARFLLNQIISNFLYQGVILFFIFLFKFFFQFFYPSLQNTHWLLSLKLQFFKFIFQNLNFVFQICCAPHCEVNAGMIKLEKKILENSCVSRAEWRQNKDRCTIKIWRKKGKRVAVIRLSLGTAGLRIKTRLLGDQIPCFDKFPTSALGHPWNWISADPVWFIWNTCEDMILFKLHKIVLFQHRVTANKLVWVERIFCPSVFQMGNQAKIGKASLGCSQCMQLGDPERCHNLLDEIWSDWFRLD